LYELTGGQRQKCQKLNMHIKPDFNPKKISYANKNNQAKDVEDRQSNSAA